MLFEPMIRRLWTQPWDIMPETLRAYVASLAPAVRDDWVDKLYGVKRAEWLPAQRDDDGVRTISVAGVLGKGMAAWELMLGATDYDDLTDSVRKAIMDTSVRAIVLKFDSGGGSGCGVVECAAAIQQARAVKPIIAYTDTCMASAAYWLGCSCTAVYASASSYVGSIGTIIPLLDISGYYEQLGIKQELFVSGPLKGAGWPGTSLTDAQRAHFQAIVDYHAGVFKGHVLANRVNVAPEAMQGQVIFGSLAPAHGLIDQMATYEIARDDAAQMVFGEREI